MSRCAKRPPGPEAGRKTSPARRSGRKNREESSASLEVERRQDVLFVTPHGRIGEVEARPFQRELLSLVDQGATKILVDLSDVPFVTSSCLSALMVAYKDVRRRAGYVRLIGPQPLVRRILEVTRLTRIFPIYRTAQEAVAARHPSPALRPSLPPGRKI